MADPVQPDLCVVGAGALGIALAQHANSLGARVTLIDRGVPERGDGPHQKLRLAALQASAARAHAMRHAEALGLADAEPRISMKAVQERAKAAAELQSAMSAHERLSALGIEMLRGETVFADANSAMVGDTLVRPRGMLLALGGQPVLPAIKGLDQVDYLTPDTILDTMRKLTHLLVIGGTGSALSLAQAFARLGSEVTLVPQGPLLTAHDSEAAALVLDVLRAEGIRIMDGAVVREILPRAQGTGAMVDLPMGETEALDISHVLLATAISADPAPLQPEKARLRPIGGAPAHYARGPLGQTSNRRIRVAGPLAGMAEWPHALVHGRAVVEKMVLGAAMAKPGPQPHLVMTDPPLAQIGRVAARARMGRSGGTLLRASLAENEQARALGMAEGLAKVELGADGRVAGAALAGPGAPEMAAVLALVMEKRISLHELARLSLPDPSLLATIVSLGEQAEALRPVPAWMARWRKLRRLLASAMP